MNRCLGLDVEWRRVSNSGPFVGLFLSLHGAAVGTPVHFAADTHKSRRKERRYLLNSFLNIKNVSVLYTL